MSSAPPTARSAAPPGNYTSEGDEIIAGLVLEPSGQLVTLWVVMFIFGNLFAFFWLSRAFLNANPQVAYQLGLVLSKCGLGKKKHRKPTASVPAQVSTAAATAAFADPLPARVETDFASFNSKSSFVTADSAEDIAIAANGTANGYSVDGIELMPSIGGPAVPSSGASRHHHYHAQPVICMPSTDIGGDSFGIVTQPSLSAPDGSLNTSLSSHSSENDAHKLPVQLKWSNMCFTATTAEGKKRIIQGIYGCANPCELQGLMGPSGAGKSTLMDLLAMRTDHDGAAAIAPGAEDGDERAPGAPVVAGTPSRLLVNGMEVNKRDFMAISAYVPQHDNLVPTMTAIESVSFYASIVLPASMPKEVRKARIARVLRMMGLSHAQNTLVGGTLPGGIMLRGMSGGERKRLAIACGVVAGPSLVFLDEPTSGLDSFAALNVVLFLKNMATEHGATLLASLHQPRQAIWSQMDQVTLLSSGRLMYTGPTDGLVPWFTSLGYAYDPEIHGMASDWALDLVSLGFTKPQHEEQNGTTSAVASSQRDGQQQGQHADVGNLRTRYGNSGDGCAQQQSTAAGSSSMARRLQQQQAALRAGSSMMCSKKEVTDAAAAFLAHLQRMQPELFSLQPALTVTVPRPGSRATTAAGRGSAPPPSASAGAAVKEPLGTAAGAAPGVFVKHHSSTASDESGPLMMHKGHMVGQGQGTAQQYRLQDVIDTQQVKLQRTQWWSQAGIKGGAPAPPTATQDAEAMAPGTPGSKWWSDASSYSEAAQLPAFSQTESPTSVTSSAILLKEQAFSSPPHPATTDFTTVGKPIMGQQHGQLSFVEESGSIVEQPVVPGAAGHSSAKAVGLPVGLAGLHNEKQSLWSKLHEGFSKYRALLWRELLITTRNPADVGGRMMTFTYVSFLSGLVGWSLPGGAESMFQRMAVCYAVLTFYFLMPFVFMSIFTGDKRFFVQDSTARLYHPAQYYLSKVTVTLPFNIVVAVVFQLVYYGMTGMRHGAGALAMACCICVLVGLIGMQAVYCCAIMASSQDLAFIYAIGWTVLNLLVNPYMMMFNQYSLGWGFSWLRFLSVCNWAWQALINIEFNGRGFDCNQRAGTEAVGLFPDLLPPDSTFSTIRNNINNLGRFSTNQRCVASGDAIIQMYTADLSFWETVGILLGFYVVFLTVTYLVVKRSARAQSKV